METSIIAGGDCLLDRYDGRRSLDQGSDRRWTTLHAAAAGSQAFLFNLETAIGRAGTARRKRFVFRAPAEALIPLAGFPQPVAALANNHTMDYGGAGTAATISALDQAGIFHAGAGNNADEAAAAATVRVDGSTIGVLSFGFDEDPGSYDGDGSGCIAPLRLGLMSRMVAETARTSTATVVMLHWGIEYDERFTGHQQYLARELVKAGADLVLGTGPHVIQGIESYEGGVICYSLGNLVFDDLGSDELTAAFLIRMAFRNSRKGIAKRFEIAPLRTRTADGGPVPPESSDGRKIALSIADRSPAPEIIDLRSKTDSSGIAWYRIRQD